MEVLEIAPFSLITAPGQPPLAVFSGPASTHLECHSFCEALTRVDNYQPPRANFGAGWNDTWWFGDQQIPRHPLLRYRLLNKWRRVRAAIIDNLPAPWRRWVY